MQYLLLAEQIVLTAWVANVGNGAPEALLCIGAAVALAGVVTSVAVRRWLEKRGLQTRIRLQMIPTKVFDPSSEEVLRVGDQLSRVRPSVHRLQPRSTAAVRIRLRSVGEGRVVTELEGPRRAESVMRQGTYAGVELRRCDEDGVEEAND